MIASIIIPTFNRDHSLRRCVHSLVRQNFSTNQYEILIIDNASTDRTKEFAEKLVKEHSNVEIRYFAEPVPGLLSGRHRGILEARGEIIILVDDDIEADKHWLSAIIETFDDPEVQLVGGRNLPKYEVDPPEWLDWFWESQELGRSCGFLSLLDFGENIREIDACFVWGLNFSIRKTAVFELGGFHPDIVPKNLQYLQGDGETGLTLKARLKKYKAIYQPKASVFHHVPSGRLTLEYFDKRNYFQGVCDSYTNIRSEAMKEMVSSKFTTLNSLEDVPVRRRIKNKIRQIRNNFLEWKQSKTYRDILVNRFRKSYLDGYKFHQNVVHRNPILLSWILKEDYWDYSLPQFEITM